MLMLPATIALRWRRSGRILSYTQVEKSKIALRLCLNLWVDQLCSAPILI